MNNSRKTNKGVEVINPQAYFPEGTPIPEKRVKEEPVIEYYRF